MLKINADCPLIDVKTLQEGADILHIKEVMIQLQIKLVKLFPTVIVMKQLAIMLLNGAKKIL